MHRSFGRPPAGVAARRRCIALYYIALNCIAFGRSISCMSHIHTSLSHPHSQPHHTLIHTGSVGPPIRPPASSAALPALHSIVLHSGDQYHYCPAFTPLCHPHSHTQLQEIWLGDVFQLGCLHGVAVHCIFREINACIDSIGLHRVALFRNVFGRACMPPSHNSYTPPTHSSQGIWATTGQLGCSPREAFFRPSRAVAAADAVGKVFVVYVACSCSRDRISGHGGGGFGRRRRSLARLSSASAAR